ncbi:MAG: bifunctional phosphoribosylaminoimidazolecarboxamide formyltransferase/IMP cyclohydrolase [Thermovirgaceae bacterium]|nr:bifunctional phosphoribosylaminoimidazolecarboxamide formyltransferase/IMP cyclohydrolase [Thermovirgaceae bacterium]
MPKRALVSVFDKRGVTELAKGLEELGWEIVSSSGTARHIREAGIAVRDVEDFTGYPHMLGGRVKTLHPSVFGGILARRNFETDLADVEKFGIPMIDMVVCNLYPFEETFRGGASLDDLLENIDIGGVTLLRAAAKNFRYVVPVTDPDDYETVISEISSEGDVTLQTREALAIKAFLRTACYDATIQEGLSRSCGTGRDNTPAMTVLPLQRRLELRYGENPHQKAALYSNPLDVASWKQISGKPLSYNNILDMDCAMRSMALFQSDCACIIIKHTTPCGIAVDSDAAGSYSKAFECDQLSAFGGIIAFTREVDEPAARGVMLQFAEVLVAPSFKEGATRLLATERPNLRVVEWNGKMNLEPSMVNTWGGTLLQDDALPPLPRPDSGDWTGSPRPDLWEDMIIAWKAAALGKSNSISLVKDGATVGLGRGFTSRIDAVYWACHQAGEKAMGSVMGSDAFFPFSDSLETAAKAGVAAVIQPGGSVRDEEVCQAALKLGISMFTSGWRTFRH